MLVVLAQPRRIALLAYLALTMRRGPQQRDALLALFWPERDEDSARNALNQALHFLRRHLGTDTFVARNGGEIGVAPERIWCDGSAFEDALDTGRPGEALELWQGELLDGFHIGDAPGFQRWLDSERSRLAGRLMQAMETLANQREAAGDFTGAVAWWRRLAARDSLSSRRALRLMQALAAAGDPAAALQHARVHEVLVRDELNAGVAPDVTALIRKLQAIQSDATAPATGAATRKEPNTMSHAAATHANMSTGVAISEPHHDPGYEADPAADPRATDARGRRSRWGPRMMVIAAGVIVLLVLGRARGSSASGAEEYLRTLYLRGQQAEVSRSLVGLQTARAAYERALERDSTYALAYAGLSAVHYLMADYGYSPVGPALDSARRMARRAVALDSTHPETRTARAVTLASSLDFDAAEREFQRAIELGPDNARAHFWYSVMLVALGRGREALDAATRAGELDPFPPRGLTAMKRYAEWLVSGKRPYLDSAVTARRPILELEPGEPWARSREAVELAEVGRCDEARAQIHQAQRLTPDNNMRMLRPVIEVHWRCGDQGRARQLLAEMKHLPNVEDHGYRVALVHILFDEPDSAFAWIARNRWTIGALSGLSADQNADAVRSDPRFVALLEEIGIRQPAR